MGLTEKILEKLTGEVHFYIFVGDNPAVEIKITEDEIILEIKNPLLAAELALDELLHRKKTPAGLEKIKDMGYKIKIKYKMVEMEL